MVCISVAALLAIVLITPAIARERKLYPVDEVRMILLLVFSGRDY